MNVVEIVVLLLMLEEVSVMESSIIEFTNKPIMIGTKRMRMNIPRHPIQRKPFLTFLFVLTGGVFVCSFGAVFVL